MICGYVSQKDNFPLWQEPHNTVWLWSCFPKTAVTNEHNRQGCLPSACPRRAGVFHASIVFQFPVTAGIPLGLPPICQPHSPSVSNSHLLTQNTHGTRVTVQASSLEPSLINVLEVGMQSVEGWRSRKRKKKKRSRKNGTEPTIALAAAASLQVCLKQRWHFQKLQGKPRTRIIFSHLLDNSFLLIN